ncbi:MULTISPECIES: type I-F CRISPR-associated protein Csy1 [Psychrobacter]|uniref:type I-F CRISPR-associated protein Csy1 n=1 Tax=Psychrobacter TaxID=497 RepID=UPI000C32ABDF|nr:MULTISPECIES: type I-F CRISPR-associated protein Csy1 [Psychrobacter]PKG35989.1 type I-F CRISPR-associated protein Csy1 [Psychrobacter sp. Sarcosine-3u-12]
MDISSELASGAVKAFLISQYDKKTDTEQKQLSKAIESSDHDKVTELKEALVNAKEKYSIANWIADAATRMAKQLNFGTHISKGVHPDAKGDNVSFDTVDNLSQTIVGTHSIDSSYIDANGNAAALPLAAFFDFEVDETTKIRDLILADNVDFIASLASDKILANTYQQTFKEALQNFITNPVTHERNKQTLWVTNAYEGADIEELDYINIVPLYPSVLTHEVYQRINHLKFSEDNKAARDNRFKKTADQQPYITLNDLATLQLGGTKPQNVSLLMSKQGGRNYLLPSLPPIIKQERSFKLSKFANSIFGTAMEYNAREAIQSIFKSIKDTRNIIDVRDARKSAIDEVLYQIFAAAEDIRMTMPAGWSKDYELERHEKLWLDPKRADLEGEEEFKAERELTDAWHAQIIHSFARWLNTLMQTEFKAIASDFGDAEHLNWEREIEDMQKRYERAGKGVFL